MHRLPFLALVLLLSMLAGSCGKSETDPTRIFSIAAGSESREIEPIIRKFARSEGVEVRMVYTGSVDMMLDLQREDFPHDAVLPANSMWIRLGDAERHRVADEASIMRTPVVLGVKRSRAEELGWIGRDVRVADILAAVRAGRLRFAMTSATQSNSGASAYIGLLYALAGAPAMLDMEHLDDPDLRDRIRELLAGVDRGAGSSGWLKDLMIRQYDRLDAMFNYEAMVIAANRELEAAGREPLHAIYPVDGLAIADSTLGFVRRSDNEGKREFFRKLRDHLLSQKIQREILKTGFRTGLIGMNPEAADRKTFKTEWGIDPARTISPVPWPPADVIRRSLSLYQTAFRKPSFTVYLLDTSGSMEGSGLAHLKTAMAGLVDPERSGRFFLQASERDAAVVFPFNHEVGEGRRVDGNRPEDLAGLVRWVADLRADGGTDIYRPIMAALEVLRDEGERLADYLPAILLMTDGKSNRGSLAELRAFWGGLGAEFDLPPVFAVTFGEADETQLRELAEFSDGRVFDGKTRGLEQAFRQVKGYN